RLKRRIDIATATVLGALGLRLIATSLTASGLHGLPAAEAADRHRHRDGAGGAGPAAYRHLPHR
ncbi:hypothetical protein CK247_25935, partial [Klebsiella pneumoniae]